MRQIYLALPTIFIAAVILFISIFKSAQVTYSFSPTPLPNVNKTTSDNRDYQLPQIGALTPGHPAWPIQALGDRLRVSLTLRPLNRSEVLLELADNRLANAKYLFEQGEVKLAVSTLTKAEKYLERAFAEQEQVRLSGANTTKTLKKIFVSSVVHKQVVSELSDRSPEEARAFIVSIGNYSQLILDKAQPLVLSAEKQIVESRILR